MQRFVLLLSTILVSSLSASAFSAETQEAVAPQPTQVQINIAAMSAAPPNAMAYGDAKQQAIGDHHRPTIELLLPKGATPVMAQAALSDPTSVAANQPGVMALTQLTNRALTDRETNDITSTVCEPTVAVRGNQILVTGNWFASFSTNGGSTFQYVNPAATFPQPAPGQPFCCDQVAIYAPSHDLMIWFLQYVNSNTGNTARVAVAKGNDIQNQNWRFYDFTPQGVGGWTNEWFDYPELALGDKFLYVTSNVFSTQNNRWTRSVILRLPLAELSQYQGFNYRHYSTTQIGSIRPTQGTGNVKYFGAHRSLNNIRILTWPENSDNVGLDDVQVQSWSDATRVAPGPDGNDFLGRADGRITAAAVSGDNIWLGWTAAQDGTFQFPHVRVAVINRNNKTLVAQPHIWNAQFAFAYPAFAPNSAGQLGLSLHYGGGSSLHPSHAYGVREGNAWDLATSHQGTHGPSDGKWGDYLSIRPHGQQSTDFVATGFTLNGGEERNNIQVRYIRFRRGQSASPQNIQDIYQRLKQLQAELDEVLKSLEALSQPQNGN